MAAILIVEDDALVARLLARYLEKLGHVVTVEPAAASALNAFDPATHQLLITDLSLDGMNGEQLAAELRKRAPALPAIIASGYPYEPQLAGVRFLQKPFLPQMLVDLVDELLR